MRVKTSLHLRSNAELSTAPSGPRSTTLTKIWSRSMTWPFSRSTGKLLKPKHCSNREAGDREQEQEVVKSRSSDSHPHLRGEGGQRREGPAGQEDAADLLTPQVLHAEARREAPVAENVSCKQQNESLVFRCSAEEPVYTFTSSPCFFEEEDEDHGSTGCFFLKELLSRWMWTWDRRDLIKTCLFTCWTCITEENSCLFKQQKWRITGKIK